jgi:hypothetical protein
MSANDLGKSPDGRASRRGFDILVRNIPYVANLK